MNLVVASQIAVAVLGVVAAAVPLLGGRTAKKDLRGHLRDDVALLKELPSESQTAAKMSDLIDREVDLIATELDLRRDPFGVGLALALILGCVVAGIWAIGEGGWWLWALVPIAIILFAASGGLAQDMTKTRRDEKGNPAKG